MHQNPLILQSTGRKEGREIAVSPCMCLFFLAQECWTESGGVYFAGTPLDRDVSAPFSAHTPEEHRYDLRCVYQKSLLYSRTKQREREIGHCILEGLLKFIQSFEMLHPEINSSCSNCVLCGQTGVGVTAVNVTFPVVRPIHTS